MSKQFLGFSK